MKQKNHDDSTITFMWIKHEHPTYNTCYFSRTDVTLDIQIEGKMGVTVKRIMIVKKKKRGGALTDQGWEHPILWGV